MELNEPRPPITTVDLLFLTLLDRSYVFTGRKIQRRGGDNKLFETIEKLRRIYHEDRTGTKNRSIPAYWKDIKRDGERRGIFKDLIVPPHVRNEFRRFVMKKP